jgi:hypothetical protein
MSLTSNNNNKITLKNITFLDWDDSIFPSSWCNKNMINLNDIETIKNYKLYFIELDKTINDFLLNLLNFGEIYIVTNANIKWIKACLNILPNTKKVIMDNNIRIVSARDLYSDKLLSPTDWKINTFRDILNDVIEKIPQLTNCGTFLNVVSIGDAHYEYIALLNLDDYFKVKNKNINYLLKSIKFIEKPSFDLVIDQVLIVKKNIKTIVNKIGYVDLKFVDQ